MPALDLRARVHDRIDAVVLLAQLLDADDRADGEQVGIGGGNAVADVDAGCRGCPLAVERRRKPKLDTHFWRLGGQRVAASSQAHVPGVESGDIEQEG